MDNDLLLFLGLAIGGILGWLLGSINEMKKYNAWLKDKIKEYDES